MSGLIERDRLVGHTLSAALDSLPQWQLSADGKKVQRTLIFADFVQAFAFMTQVAAVAEDCNHHPEWSNVWNKVDLALTTHTACGITCADIVLAKAIDQIAAGFELSCDLDGGTCGGCK